MILFTFRVIFVQSKNYSIKIIVQNYISGHKMNQFYVPNRRKAIKGLILVSKGSLLSKKIEFYFRAPILENVSYFFGS